MAKKNSEDGSVYYRLIGEPKLAAYIGNSKEYKAVRKALGTDARHYQKGNYISDVLSEAYKTPNHIEGAIPDEFLVLAGSGTKESKTYFAINLSQEVFENLTKDADQSIRSLGNQIRYVMVKHAIDLTVPEGIQ